MKWEQVAFGEVCELINGRAFCESDWSPSGLPIIRIQNLNDAKKPFNYWQGALDRQVSVRPGDMLLAWSGTPGTSFGAHKWQGPQGVLNQHIFRVDLDQARICMDWAVRAVNASLGHLIGAAHGGVGLKHVTRPMVEGLRIPLPPLAEQRRIAAILDHADALRAKRRTARAVASQLKQAEFFRRFGDPISANVDWERKPLTELCNIKSGGTPSKENEEFWKGSVPWFSAKDLKTEDLLDSQDHISERVLRLTNLRLVPAGTIVILVRRVYNRLCK